MKALMATVGAMAVGGLMLASSATAEVERFDIFNQPLGIFGGVASFDLLGPGGQSQIVNTRFVLNYTTQTSFGEYQAEDVVLIFQAPVCNPDFPVGGLPTVRLDGGDLGWFGSGTFTADFTTPELNGTTVKEDFGLYLIELTFQAPATMAGGVFTDSYIEVEYMPRTVCEADMNCDLVVDIFDLLVFLDFYFSGNDYIDLNRDTMVDIFDMLAYLDLWFTGCPPA